MSRGPFVEYLRALEVLYRGDGRYESAVQVQATADGIAALAEGKLPSCSWFQRGIHRVPEVFGLDGMLGIELHNGMVHYLTEDAAADLWWRLTGYLKITAADLRQAARELDAAEHEHSVDYDAKPFTPDPKDLP